MIVKVFQGIEWLLQYEGRQEVTVQSKLCNIIAILESFSLAEASSRDHLTLQKVYLIFDIINITTIDEVCISSN